MISLRLCGFFLCLGLVFTSNALWAEASVGPVWKVSKGDHHLFVGGTIHVLSAEDYPLPSGFDQAYLASDVLVFEADISQMQTPQIQQLILDRTQYRQGQSLRADISDDTYAYLQRFSTKRGVDIQNLTQFKAGMVTIILTLNELSLLGQAGQGVDDFFHQRAVADNKPIYFLETIEQQIDFLANMGVGQQDDLLVYTLKELDNLRLELTKLKSAWRSGDPEELEAVALAPWQADFPVLYESLLVKRNQAWLPQLENMLATPEVEYVLVGALHLSGDAGVLTMLRERGYLVKAIQQ